MLRYLWISLLVVLLDQASKFSALALLGPYDRVEVLPVFNLVLVFNEGAAFGLLGDAGGWQRLLFMALALVVAVVLVVWLARLQAAQRWLALGLALILGGALGNLIDRLWLGAVIDFLDFHWRGLHWPAFNLADSALTLGVILLLIDAYGEYRAGGEARRRDGV